VRFRAAPPPTPQGPYTEWFWPHPPVTDGRPGFAAFEHTLVPEIDPGPAATYFWAHQFGLEGGEGGYLGLQTRGNRVDGSLGKLAIFSLWDATGAEAAPAGPGSSLVDLDAGAESQIGRLRAAPGWGGLRAWSVMWTEYYGPPLRHCSDLVPVSAVLGMPVADGMVIPVRSSSHVGDGTCDTTRITDLDGSVRHEMGLQAP